MKPTFYLLFLISLVFMGACNKKDDDSAFVYMINNVQSISLSKNSTVQLPLETKYVSGTQEPVTLAVTGLPAGVTYSFSATSGTPTFTSVLTLTAGMNTPEGNYPIKITGTSASTGTKSYDLTLTITGLNMTSYMLGNWNLAGDGSDMNNNNVVDPGEITPPMETAVYSFLPNNQGVVTFSFGNFNFNWFVVNNETTLRVVLNGEVSDVTFHSVQPNTLILKDNKDTPATWISLAR